MLTTTKTVVTADTGETITAAVLTDYHTGDGYDWMDEIAGAGWATIPNWGSEGWDVGQWPFVIVAAAKTGDEKGPLYGVATYCECDTTTRWYRAKGAQWEAITDQAFFSWTMGQAAGPADLPATAGGLPDRDRRPVPGLDRPRITARERALPLVSGVGCSHADGAGQDESPGTRPLAPG